MKQKRKYWFRPLRFWKWFAFYVPTALGGWLSTLLVVVFLIVMFSKIESMSQSAGDTFLAFAPWFAAVLLMYDFLCLHLGEYPSWWRKR